MTLLQLIAIMVAIWLLLSILMLGLAKMADRDMPSPPRSKVADDFWDQP